MIQLTALDTGALSRPNLFPGRAMGEQAFDQLQAYADARLAPLLAGHAPGVLHGLEVDLLPPRDGAPAGEGLRVRAGLAVAGNGRALGLYGTVRDTWCDLVRRYLRDTGSGSAAGVHYLVLGRRYLPWDASPGIDPCQRAELDPNRDLRTVAIGSLALRRLPISAAALAAMTAAELANRIAADNVDGAFLRDMGHAVPLGLLRLEALAGDPTVRWQDADADTPLADLGYALGWFSQSAGRYPALAGAGHRVLLAQSRDALFAARDAALGAGGNVGDALEAGLKLGLLPAAGELPLELLEDAAARAPARPRLRWLPAHVAVDMVPVREAAVPDLVQRHLERNPVDLRQPNGERLRLLLALSAADYRPDLLDIPVIDAKLADDLYRCHRHAHLAWLDWHREFDRLYHLLDQGDLSTAEVKALALPTPEPVLETPAAFYDRFKGARRDALTAGPADPPDLYPYDAPNPAAPQGYADWLAANDGAPPAPPTPAVNGLVVQYRTTQVEMERTDNRIRTLRQRLEKTRDYVLLQRQQLDSQTVSLASLAGGVAGDGSGLQVARWLPFTELVGASGSDGGGDASGGGQADGGGDSGGSAPPSGGTGAGISLSSIGTLSLDQPVQLADSFNFANAFSGVQAARATTGGSTNTSGSGIQAAGARGSFLQSAVKGIPASSRLRDANASTVELGLKFAQLNRLKAAPKRAITEPAFQGQSYRFGALDQIRPEVNAYAVAFRGMTQLLETLGAQFEEAEAAQIRGELEGLGGLTDPKDLPDLPAGGASADSGEINGIQARYQGLFAAGQLLTRRIALMEGRYDAIESELEAALRLRISQETSLEKLASQIEESRQRLDGLERRREERLGDYGVARTLSTEDFARVRGEHLQRMDILGTRVRGLFYVRERAAPVSMALADPLSLRHANPGDPVPGCDWETDIALDAELSPFFDALLEVPMDAWAVLRPLRQQLPAPVRQEYLYALRGERLKQRTQRAVAPVYSAALAGHLAPLLLANTTLLGAFGAKRAPRPAGSLAGYNDASAQVLSLSDLLSGGSGGLQRAAQQLHNRLEQCIGCLRRRLAAMQPSLRLRWAQLAEDDRLLVDQVGRWPGLADAEAADFDNTRTAAELVGWWFRQLADAAGADARSALRDMIRATVIVAARADPQEILRGKVAVPPRRLALGEVLRVQLNRPAAIGAQLQLLDDARRPVGLIRVQDQDERGAVADIVRLDAVQATVTTRFTVLANAAVQKLA